MSTLLRVEYHAILGPHKGSVATVLPWRALPDTVTQHPRGCVVVSISMSRKERVIVGKEPQRAGLPIPVNAPCSKLKDIVSVVAQDTDIRPGDLGDQAGH